MGSLAVISLLGITDFSGCVGGVLAMVGKLLQLQSN